MEVAPRPGRSAGYLTRDQGEAREVDHCYYDPPTQNRIGRFWVDKRAPDRGASPPQGRSDAENSQPLLPCNCKYLKPDWQTTTGRQQTRHVSPACRYPPRTTSPSDLTSQTTQQHLLLRQLPATRRYTHVYKEAGARLTCPGRTCGGSDRDAGSSEGGVQVGAGTSRLRLTLRLQRPGHQETRGSNV